MDHLHADEIQAAERYVLGELPATDAEDFELHYFECQQCAMAVESATLFAANARVVLREAVLQESERPVVPVKSAPEKSTLEKARQSPGFFAGLWARPAMAVSMACALLFGAIGLYEGAVVIPGLRNAVNTARALPAFQLIGASRGEGAQIKIPSGTLSFALSMDLPPETHFAEYVCMVSSGGQTIFQVHAPAPADGQPITILVPAQGLQPGAHELSVFGVAPDGQQSGKISTYSFDLQFNH